jgi:DNA-binding Xre family transcriptional regulator
MDKIVGGCPERRSPIVFHYFPQYITSNLRYDFHMEIKIWEERAKRNISLLELERRTGISKSALNNYENGKRYPTLQQMEKIAIALNTSISNLYESRYK